MERSEIIEEFKAGLINGTDFIAKKIDDAEWEIESAKCKITLIFDHYGDDYLTFVTEPGVNYLEGVHMLLLRHCRKAVSHEC